MNTLKNIPLRFHTVLLSLMMLLAPSLLSGKNFKVIDITNGLSNNTVKCIAQDTLGFMWFGTFDGLCRFNGVSFTTYRHSLTDSLSLINSHVEALLTVDDGLLAGTVGGMSFYSYKNNNFQICRKILPSGDTLQITTPIRNIVSVGKEVFVLDTAWKLYRRTKEAFFEPFDCRFDGTCLSIAPYKGKLLLVHTSNSLLMLDTEKKKIVARLVKPAMKTIDNVLYYSHNKDLIYIGTGIGYTSEAYKLTADNTFEEVKANLPSNVKAIADYNNGVLFGTDGNGLVYQAKDVDETYLPNNSKLSSDAVHALFIDRNKELWAGTYRGGVNLYSECHDWFKSMTLENKELTYNVVTAIFKERNLLYIGLDGGGLNIRDLSTDKITSYTTANSRIAGNNVLSVIGDKQSVWLGIYGKGVCHFSPSTNLFQTYSLPSVDGNPNPNKVWEIKDDGRGNIWILGDNVYVFSQETRTFTRIYDYKYASGIIFDGDAVWIASTVNGLFKVNRRTGKTIKSYSKESRKNPIADNSIRYIFMDSHHNIWFATEFSGLFKLDTTSDVITSYGVNQKLTATHVTAIQEDASGHLWMSSSNGLFRFNTDTETFIRFGKEDYLPTAQFNYNASFQDEGRIYFGSTSGLIWFVPESIKYAHHPNNICFTGFEILGSEKKSIQLYSNNPEVIRLPYNQNFFTIHFSMPEMVTPNKTLYACYMQNFEKGWQQIEHSRQVSYTNVPPGEYVFAVKASDSEGNWNENASYLHIIIMPPWWRTTWAWCLWAIIFLSVLFFIFWFYRYELNIKHLVQLKELEKDMARNINEAKLRFYTNITHELRTPIFLITAPLEELLDREKSPVMVSKSHLLAMHRNAMKLNKLISRIIDFRKLESGKLALETQCLNVVAFCKDLIVDYEALCQQKNIIFHYLPAKTIIKTSIDPEKLETILSNLVSNAFKYTPEGGKIVLSIDENEDNVTFVVEDSGIGIKKEFHETIFDRFFQIDPSQTTSVGDGIGLSFVKHLVELHGGTVRVESEPDKGSKFILNFPLQKVENEQDTLEEAVLMPVPTTEVPKAVMTALSPTATHTILIIDDEREILDMLEQWLVNDFKILKAGNGADGLALAQEMLPDIIICDVMMPKMTGTEFLVAMKNDKKIAHIPVIMLTAKTSEEDQMIAFDSGADAYLTKPISLKYLRKRIDNLLAHSESAHLVNILTHTEKNYTKEEQHFLLKCREVIDDNLNNATFEVVTFSEKMGVSHSSLYRKIKAITGLSVIELINEYRIFKAVQYFKEGETNITTVCLKCGFNDIKNFRDMFKRKMGVTPKQYVQQL